MSGIDSKRRQFLSTGSAALAGVVLAPGLLLFGSVRGSESRQESVAQIRWGLLIDTNQCVTGCNDCVLACDRENRLSGGTTETSSQWIRIMSLKDPHSGQTHTLPMMCQHCEQPPCVDVCPTGASFKRADGIVLVDRHICIGCRYCMMACPYKARSFVHHDLTHQNPNVPRGKGCVEGCNMCVQRIDKGQLPACVDACAAAGRNAIIFGDLNDPNSAIAKRIAACVTRQVRADLGLNPGVQYQGI